MHPTAADITIRRSASRLGDHAEAADAYDRALSVLLQLYPDGASVDRAGLLAPGRLAARDGARADVYASKQKEIEAKLKLLNHRDAKRPRRRAWLQTDGRDVGPLRCFRVGYH